MVGPVPGEPVRHGFSAAFLRACPGLPVSGSGPLLHGEHSQGYKLLEVLLFSSTFSAVELKL